LRNNKFFTLPLSLDGTKKRILNYNKVNSLNIVCIDYPTISALFDDYKIFNHLCKITKIILSVDVVNDFVDEFLEKFQYICNMDICISSYCPSTVFKLNSKMFDYKINILFRCYNRNLGVIAPLISKFIENGNIDIQKFNKKFSHKIISERLKVRNIEEIIVNYEQFLVKFYGVVNVGILFVFVDSFKKLNKINNNIIYFI
jgi:hypothetical protein